MRTFAAKQLVEQSCRAIGQAVASDFTELLPAITHQLTTLADVTQFTGRLQQAVLAARYFLGCGQAVFLQVMNG